MIVMFSKNPVIPIDQNEIRTHTSLVIVETLNDALRNSVVAGFNNKNKSESVYQETAVFKNK